MNARFAAVLVPGSSHAVALETLLRDRGVACKMIPVPRQLASDCGVCVRIAAEDAGRVREICAAAGFGIEDVREYGAAPRETPCR